MRKAMVTPLLLLCLFGVLTQSAYWSAVQSPSAAPAASCAVLVLGYPSDANGDPGAVQRFRVGAGVDVYRKHACEKLVLSGAAVRNEHIEAVSMAAVARGLGVAAEALALETRARTTWENVGCAAGHAGNVERVYVVSDSIHARRAVRYACRQGAGHCQKYEPAGAVPGVDLFLWSMFAAANELRLYVGDVLLFDVPSAENAPACSGDLAIR